VTYLTNWAGLLVRMSFCDCFHECGFIFCGDEIYVTGLTSEVCFPIRIRLLRRFDKWGGGCFPLRM
jgi:hypothetical protein